jgi:hypothetical protein
MGRLARHPSPGVQRWLAERRMAVGKEIRVTPNSGVELVLIPGGSFFMGSPESEKDRSQGEGPRLRRFVKNTTPRAVQACHELILWLIPQLDKFPRSRRFTLEERLETILLEILELLVEAFFSRDADKREALKRANLRLEVSRHLWRLADELQVISTLRYGHGAKMMTGLGTTGGRLVEIKRKPAVGQSKARNAALSLDRQFDGFRSAVRPEKETRGEKARSESATSGSTW